MSHRSYSNIFLHATWHTEGNKPVLEGKIRNLIYTIIRRKCTESKEVECLALGGTPDHLHLAIKVPATLTISKWIGELKGATSYNLNKAHPEIPFAWQKGYGVSSFSGKDLDVIIRYIQNQEIHHTNGSLKDEFEAN